MNKIQSIFCAGLISASLLSFNAAGAQGNSVSPSFNETKSALTPEGTNVSFRAAKDFTRNYKAATNARWHKIDDGFIADFNLDGVKCKSAYTKKGNWVYTIKYYGEDHLPKDIRNLVRSTYYDLPISQVEQVEVPENLVYMIHIQDKNEWKILRVADGEMQIYKEGKF